jgi:hypothetical protein
MSRPNEDDAPNRAVDESKSEGADPDAPVVPEAGEGPIPPVAGEPRPPIGN